jgi:hypothetical protein
MPKVWKEQIVTVWEMHKKARDGSTIIQKSTNDEKLILGWSKQTNLEDLRSFILHMDTYDWVFTENGPFMFMPETGEKNN